MILEAPDRLSEEDRTAVLRIIAAATSAEGRSPVSEQTLLHLRDGDDVIHLLARDQGVVVGYGILLPGRRDSPRVSEVAVAPDSGGLDVARLLLEELIARAGGSGLNLWAHGRHARTAGLASAMGFARQRVLLRMDRSLSVPVPTAPVPDGYTIRTFRPGRDDAALLRANAEAFTALPDQGGWVPHDLAARMEQPWFDAEGLFLAQAAGARADQLAGFHWTKLHREAGAPLLGEVYVLAVTPAHQGRGLARALAVLGLVHLAGAGAARALLYVDESNDAAMRLYQRLGFVVGDVDMQFVAPPV